MQGRDGYPIFLELFFRDSFDNDSKQLAKFSTALRPRIVEFEVGPEC
jgi:hypothetical protein